MIPYVLIPIAAWLVAGCVKFLVNFLRFGRAAFALIGNGGFPSTHTTVVSSAVFFVVFKEGVNSSAAVVAMALLLVVVIDAMGLRRAVGRQAAALNTHVLHPAGETPLRERQGHKPYEVAGGLLLGLMVAWLAGGVWL